MGLYVQGDAKMEYVIQDSRLKLALGSSGNGLALSLTDIATGQEWASPLLQLEIYSKAEFRAEIISEYRIDLVEQLYGGLHICIADSFRQVRVGLWLRLVDGELSVAMPLAEVYEDRPERYRLFSVIMLPGLAKVAGGQLLLPLNTGAICNIAGKPKLADRFMIYGEQTRWELLPTLPVCGAQSSKGGFCLIAKQGAEETECHASTDGAGGGSVAFAFSLRQFWPDLVEFGERELLYVPLKPADDLLHFSAKRLRKHIMVDLGKPTLKARVKESPELASLIGSYIMKLFYGVENRGIMMYGSQKGNPVTFNKVMDFAEAKAGLNRLHDAGVAHIHTQSVGWHPRGHDGMYPTHFPIEARLGGESAFRDLIESGKALGYTMTVHDNIPAMYDSSPAFDPDMVVHDQWGNPMGLGEWGGGVNYVPCSQYLTEERIEREMLKVKALGLNGPAYLDGMGNPLYRDYHPRHRATRSEYARMTNRCLDSARKLHNSVATECGFLYCALHADCLCTGGGEWMWKICWPSWPVTQMMDKRVPLWELALHGLVLREAQNASWTGVMECILFGDHPRDEWSMHAGVMPVLDDARVHRLKAIYDLALMKHGQHQTEELLKYSEPAPGVKCTAFAGGVEVSADFNKQELFVNGKKVERPAGL